MVCCNRQTNAHTCLENLNRGARREHVRGDIDYLKSMLATGFYWKFFVVFIRALKLNQSHLISADGSDENCFYFWINLKCTHLKKQTRGVVFAGKTACSISSTMKNNQGV